MTRETDLLKQENVELLAVLTELDTFVHDAARSGTAVHEVERVVWHQVLQIGRKVPNRT